MTSMFPKLPHYSICPYCGARHRRGLEPGHLAIVTCTKCLKIEAWRKRRSELYSARLRILNDWLTQLFKMEPT